MSRLLENSTAIRFFLTTRNLYTPDDPYHLDNRQVVKTVNALASIIKPFSSFDLTNTVIGRLIGPNTPIAQIGLQMLGKQFAATVASNASSNFLPSIKFENLFDGDPSTKFLMRKQDFQITRREGQNNLGRILDAITGVYDYRNHGNPFSKQSTWNKRIGDNSNEEYVRNSGKGQLQLLVKNINDNLYKLQDSGYNNAIAEKDLLISLGDDQLVNQAVFPFQDEIFYPYQQYQSTQSLIGIANDRFIASEREFLRGNKKNGVVEYGNSEEYLTAMGKTFIRDNNNGAGNYNFNSYNFGIDDGFDNQLVWGRDGVSFEYRNESLGMENPMAGVTAKNPRFDWNDKIESFNIKTGLLNYTKELLNSKGKYGSFDMTRKKFKDTKEQLHFNGSPLDTRPDTGELDLSRRHSAADPYDRFVKAIRFDGNKIYNGNADSVIYNNVIPKFHPTYNNQMVDNRNLMFSIENLAVEVIKDEDAGVGYIKDEMATSLPLCEAGANGGRLMWFPPYDVRLSENAVARWDTTEFLGRGEPIYTYSNSERLASMSFKMLIDYPQQLINYRERGEGEYQKAVSEFFAFGGESPSPEFDTNLSQKEALLKSKIKDRDSIKPKKIYIEPNLPSVDDHDFYFPNDYPKVDGTGSVSDVINMGYEDGIDEGDNEVDGVDYGLNKSFIEDFSSPSLILTSLFNPDDDVLHNEEGDPYIDIYIGAGATSLFNSTRTGVSQEEYNKALSRRRQLAMKEYIEQLFLETFGKNARELKVNIFTPVSAAFGSVNASDNTSTVESVPTKEAKLDRYAEIVFQRNGNMLTKEEDSTVDDDVVIFILNEEIYALQDEIKNIKKRMATYSPCVFESPNKNGGYEKGFSSTFNDRFYSIFHTQNPEDFHRRLTFLQQCTRQGAAIRVSNNNGIASSKNSVFGRQPVCVLRFGDFFHTKMIIENISFTYDESTWDLNPEGRGMQPMICDITMQLKIIGGQSLRTPIDALQNAVSFNYYANSTYTKDGLYSTPALMEAEQNARNRGLNGLSPGEVEELIALRAEKDNRFSDLYKKIPQSTE